MATPNSLPILVVGSGPSGLAAALSLAQNGVPIRVVEKVPEFHRASRGSGIQPRTMELFRFLGIAGDIRRIGTAIPPLRSYKLPGGTEVLRTWRIVEPHEPTPDRPESELCLSQYLTEDVLRDHLTKYGVRVERSTELVSLEQKNEAVTVIVKKTGPDGSETTETVRAAYVVGADGARGATRRAIGVHLEGETKDADGQVWADCALEGDLDHNYWHVWADGQKFTIAMRWNPVPQTYHVGIVGQDFDPIDILDPIKFEEFFHEKTGRKDVVFKRISALTYWKPKMRMIKQFRQGRVFISGDAAYVHSPTGGQGLNTSVQDSFNLAWKLALAYKGLASPSLLDTYDAERLPVVKHMLAVTTGLYANVVQTLATNVVQWRDNSLRQLEINYRWSPVVLDVRGFNGLNDDELKARAYLGYIGEDVRAGDRAPDAPGLIDTNGEVAALFDIFKPNVHIVLVFQPDVEATGAIVQALVASQWHASGIIQVVVLNRKELPQEVEGARGFHDKEGYAYKHYNVDGSAERIVVVRPDSYVGAFVNDFDGVKAYFSRILADTYFET